MELNVVAGPRLLVPSETVRPGHSVKFQLEPPPGLKSVDWQFDDSDPIVDGGTELPHTFTTRGTHVVSATVHWDDSDPIVLRRDVAIIGDTPQAKIQIGRAEDAAGEDAHKFSLGETLPLINSGKGDMREQKWSVKRPGETEYTPIPINTTTLPLNGLGAWSIHLESVGWPDIEGNIETSSDSVDLIVNPRPNRVLFFTLSGFLTIAWIFLGYVLIIGNRPRHWWLYHKFVSPPDANKMIPYKLNRKGVWSWRHKRARVPLHRFTSTGYWVDDGRHEFVEVSKIRGADGPAALIGYSGESTTGVRQGRVIPITEDATERQVKIEESRMPQDRQALYLIVKKKSGSELVPWCLFVLCTALLIGIVAALDRFIFGL